MEKKIESFTYETKCRKCGYCEEWYFAKKGDIETKAFYESIYDKMSGPILMWCKKCEQKTVQDIIAIRIPD